MNGLLKRIVSPGLAAGSFTTGILSDLLRYLSWVAGWQKLKRVDYESLPDDVFLATYPRSGTTWLQMMLYQLITDGEMRFSHISERIPWLERIPFSGLDVRCLPSPRVFKTHLPYSAVPKGQARYIYFCRDGRDVVVSYYHFYRSHLRETSTEFPEFFERFMQGKVQYGTWFDHVAGWWERRDDSNVLFLWYEDAKADLAGTLRIIADFCGIDISEADLARPLERCSFEFMKKHEWQFDHAAELLWEGGITRGTFMYTGRTGQGEAWLTEDQQQRLDAGLKKHIGMSVAEFRKEGARSWEAGVS